MHIITTGTITTPCTDASMLQSIESYATLDNRTRMLLMTLRRALIMVLAALEDYLQMERSIK
jgi:hypothetical protein